MTTRSAGTNGRKTTKIGLALAILIAPVVAVATPTPVQADVAHTQTVPETPRRNLPKVRNGEVLAADRVGDRLVVGGTFTSIERPDGSFVTQPYLAAFDINTGEFDETFRPQLDGRVLTIEAGEQWNEVFIGGGFKNVDAVAKRYVAKLDLQTGTVDPSWRASTTGWVYELARHGDRLFIGGNFGKVRGAVHQRLAEVDTDRGRLAGGFNIDITGQRITGCRVDGWCQFNSWGPIVQGLEVTPDGSTLVLMHTGDLVGGEQHWGVALIDISGENAAVRPWKTNLWPASDFVGITDGALSPDGSYVALTTKIGNFPPLHDTAMRFDVDPSTWNNTNMQPTWVTQNFDSTFAVAISDAAVYIGGHFCWTEGPGSSATGWPGSSGNIYSCQGTGGGVFNNTVYRYHQAALDPATGTALPWDSPADSFTGSKFMAVIDRGLLVGHDGGRMNQIDVGKFGFYDLGPAYDDTPPPPADPTCLAEVDGSTVTVTWDDETADRWSLRRDGGWVATLNAPTASHVEPGVADGTYSYVLRQLNGPKSDVACGEVVVESEPVDEIDPETTLTRPLVDEEELLANGDTLAGAATDNVGVTSVQIEVRDRGTGLYLQSDGSWGSWTRLDATLDAPGATSSGWTLPIDVPVGAYTVWARAYDEAGNRDATKARVHFRVR